MTTAAEAFAAQVTQRPPAERMAVVEQILESLDPPDASLDALSAKEADDRPLAYRRGEIQFGTIKPNLGIIEPNIGTITNPTEPTLLADALCSRGASAGADHTVGCTLWLIGNEAQFHAPRP